MSVRFRRFACLAPLLGCWLAWPGATSGQTPEMLQQFFIAETVFLQDRYELQVTLGAVYRAGPVSRIWRRSAGVEFGLTERLQISAGFPFVSLTPTGAAVVRGLGNTGVGVAYGLFTDVASLAVTIGLDVGLPGRHADSLLAEGRVVWEPRAVIARQIGLAQLHLSAAVELGAQPSLSANLALVFPLRELRLITEVNWLGNNDPVLFFTPGLIWQAPRGLEVGVGVPIGLSADAPSTNLIVKLTYQVAL